MVDVLWNKKLDDTKIAQKVVPRSVFFSCNLGLNVFDHELDLVLKHPLIKDRTIGMEALSEKCRSCEFVLSCGAGYYPHRFDKVNRFRNPTIYCSDYLKLFRHIQKSLDIELTDATCP